MSIHEKYGRLREQYEDEVAQHRQTIAVLAGLKDGSIDPARLTVDAEKSTWTLQPLVTEPDVRKESVDGTASD